MKLNCNRKPHLIQKKMIKKNCVARKNVDERIFVTKFVLSWNLYCDETIFEKKEKKFMKIFCDWIFVVIKKKNYITVFINKFFVC